MSSKSLGGAGIKAFIKKYAMMLVFVVIVIFFTIMTDGIFLQPRNLSNLFRQMAIIGVLATGMSLVIVSGNIDLSVGTFLGFVSGLASAGMVWWNWRTPAAILLGILVGVVVGFLHGMLIAYLKLPAFITTLGTQFVFRGGLLGVIKGQTVAPLHESFVFIGQGYLARSVGWIIAIVATVLFIISVFNRRKKNKQLGIQSNPIGKDIVKIIAFIVVVFVFVYLMNIYEGIPVPTLILLGLSLLYTFIAEKQLLVEVYMRSAATVWQLNMPV